MVFWLTPLTPQLSTWFMYDPFCAWKEKGKVRPNGVTLFVNAPLLENGKVKTMLL